MKEIKDYLKYYIGCEVIGKYDDENRRGILTGIKNGSYECEIQFFEEDDFNVFEWPEFNDSSDIKLRLRRLDSVTEEEAIAITDILIPEGRDKKAADDIAYKIDYGKMLVKRGIDQHYLSGRGWFMILPYLLSNGFDIFDLIDDNLAIDINLPTQ